MLKTIKLSLFFLCSFHFASAQTMADALRYSVIDVGGTARTVGVGGAIGALGADFTVLSTNPAGLAMYRKSELTFTPTFYVNQSDATLTNEAGNSSTNDSRSNFNFNNVGVVLSNVPYAPKWKTSNVAIGVNRINNFSRKVFYEGTSTGSYTDRFLELATDETGEPLLFGQLDQFEAGLAATTGAIIDLTSEPVPRWESDFLDNPPVFKDQVITSSGATSELLFGWGTNYDEKIMLGISVGVPIVSYSETKTYREVDTGESRDGDIPVFNDFTFEERLVTSGVGVNIKAGLIYRATQAVRIGLAFHSPTVYSFTDDFSTFMEYSYTDGFTGLEERIPESSPDGNFEYRFSTPWRVLGSFGYIVGKSGFISAEVEYLDYGNASFNLTRNANDAGTRQYQNELNGELEDGLSSTVNVRVGGEYAINAFRVRAGLGINGNPYASNLNLSSTAISTGLGWRTKGFYADFAYKLKLASEEYSPYRLVDESAQQSVDIDSKIHRLLLTIGLRF